ncbi:hypothetical protein L2E82_32348 [Cichorium intybus]|uniref:Uncharacterized protein n=1 Tax=Cichorium intybus TaxID=13427 RepID=A0ACB9BG59_CICIN|nr:hypothetical protein L2E82_32348 [Cichorium intybus]
MDYDFRKIMISRSEAIGDLFDKEVLLGLNSFLEQGNKVNQPDYIFTTNETRKHLHRVHGQVANLSANNFSGEIGSSIDRFPKLEYVDMSVNSLIGNLSFGFHSLEALDLSENALTGKIPTVISNCNNLTVMNLWGNFFSRSIPGELALIHNIRQLFLGNNTLWRL